MPTHASTSPTLAPLPAHSAPHSTPASAPAASPTPSTDPFAYETARDRLRRRLLESTADLCAARGHRRILLCGRAGDLWAIARQPWQWRNLRVLAMLSDELATPFVRGVPVIRGATDRSVSLDFPPDAIVVCSEEYEHLWHDRAAAWAAAQSAHHPAVPGSRPQNIDILRPYFSHPAWEPDDVATRRLIDHTDLSPADARWLIDNRAERHDATLPMLLPARTELHLRRYEFAARWTAGRHVADIACGLGYGSTILMSDGGARSYTGIDISPDAVAYASRRFARPGVAFRAVDAAATGLHSASFDLITSFETIEHVPDPAALLREFARLLAPAGFLVLSTPNDWGLTAHHVHSFTPDSLAHALRDRFHVEGWWTQVATTQRLERGLPEGIARRRDQLPLSIPHSGPTTATASPAAPAAPTAAETLLVVARRRDGFN